MESPGQLGDATAPRAPRVLLFGPQPQLLKVLGAAGVLAIQQRGPPPRAVGTETDLTFHCGILGQRLHRGP
jgi:hypothetical protein